MTQQQQCHQRRCRLCDRQTASDTCDHEVECRWCRELKVCDICSDCFDEERKRLAAMSAPSDSRPAPPAGETCILCSHRVDPERYDCEECEKPEQWEELHERIAELEEKAASLRGYLRTNDAAYEMAAKTFETRITQAEQERDALCEVIRKEASLIPANEPGLIEIRRRLRKAVGENDA